MGWCTHKVWGALVPSMVGIWVGVIVCCPPHAPSRGSLMRCGSVVAGPRRCFSSYHSRLPELPGLRKRSSPSLCPEPGIFLYNHPIIRRHRLSSESDPTFITKLLNVDKCPSILCLSDQNPPCPPILLPLAGSAKLSVPSRLFIILGFGESGASHVPHLWVNPTTRVGRPPSSSTTTSPEPAKNEEGAGGPGLRLVSSAPH